MFKKIKSNVLRLFATVLAITGLITALPTTTVHAANGNNLGWGYVKNTTTVYRYMYLTSSVGTVYAGEGVTVLAEEDDSYYIEYSTSSSAKRGYVSKSSIQTEGYETCTGVLNTNATVYYGKGTSYGRVGTIYSGEYVSVLANDGTWTYVEYNSPGYRKRGYIPTSSLQIIGQPSGMKSVYKATSAPETWGMYNFGSVYAGPSTQYAKLLTVNDAFTEVTVTLLAEFTLNSRQVDFVEFNNNGTVMSGYILH